MLTDFIRFLRNEEGATAIEYGLLLSLMVILALPALILFGHGMQAMIHGILIAMGGGY